MQPTATLADPTATPVQPGPDHPSTPVRLTGSRLACAGCGIATARPGGGRDDRLMHPAVFTVEAYRHESEPITRDRPITTELTRCPTCRGIADRAVALCLRHPVLPRRLGTVAAWRIETILSGLAAIGVTPEAEVLDCFPVLLRHLSASAGSTRWQTRCAPTVLDQSGPGWCAPEPWACAPPAALTAVRQGWGRVLAERVAATRPPVVQPCPTGPGCAMCGVNAVTVPAAAAQRDADAGRSSWSATTVTIGADTVHVALCPPCAAAVEKVGSVGPTSAEHAVLAWLTATGRDDDAMALRAALTGDEAPRIVPFVHRRDRKQGARKRPWQHVSLQTIRGDLHAH